MSDPIIDFGAPDDSIDNSTPKIAFLLGAEYASVYYTMLEGIPFTRLVRAKNLSRLDLLARRIGYVMSSRKAECEAHSSARFVPLAREVQESDDSYTSGS